MNFEGAKDLIIEKQRKGLSPDLSYHSLEHILDVYEAAKQLAKLEGISDETDLQLLLTAALFHDSGFLTDRVDHEVLSCQIAKKHLPDFEYSPSQVEKICGMILATRIPSTPKNHLEEILCDADLDYLGREDFEEIGAKLYLELTKQNLVLSLGEWNKIQIQFLEKHRYYTKTAQYLRESGKQRHLEELKLIGKV
jgi:predicted metal-dependent HD superfamily phosphohydrolase